MNHASDSSFHFGALSQSELLGRKAERSFCEEALSAAAYAAVQAPLSAVAQIVDKACKTDVQSTVRFMDAPAESQFLSTRWHAQQLGGALGMVAPFLLLHKSVGAVGSRVFGQVEANTTQALSKRVIGEAVVTGGLYEGVFRPVNQKDGDFLTAKLRNAATGALTFGTLAAGAAGIKDLVKAERGVMGRVLRSEAGAGILASLPAGFVNAEASTLFAGKGFASRADVAESMYSFVFAGGALSLGKAALGGTRAETALNRNLSAESVRSIADGAPTLAERARAGMEVTKANVASAVEAISGPRLRPALATGGLEGTYRPETVVHMSSSGKLRGGLNGRPGGIVPPDLAERIKGNNVEGISGDGCTPSTAETSAAKPVPEQVRQASQFDGPSREIDARLTEKSTTAAEKPVVEVKPAEVFPDGTFYFMDCNSPGVVYRGTEAHMNGLLREGGFPDRCKISRPVTDEKMRFEIKGGPAEWWEIQPLPPDHFWTWPNERYYDRSLPVEDYAVTRAKELKELSQGTLLEKPVPQEVWTRAMGSKLHPHSESVVVFLEGEKVIYFEGINGTQATFSLRDCAKANLMKARLSGHDVSGAVVFTPSPIRVNEISLRPLKPTRFFGIKPNDVGPGTLEQFLERRK